MANISTGIKMDSNFMNLKNIELSKVRPEVQDLLVSNENIVSSFATVRDQVVFTN